MNRFLLPSPGRFLAVDAGGRSLKALVVSAPFGRIHVHASRIFPLDETSQPGSPGWPRLLQELAADLGPHPLAISVPQHATDSQVLDLPGADDASIRELIQADVLRLGGLTESAIIYDYGRMEPFAAHSQPFWITHAREGEVLAAVARFADLHEEVWEISSPANAMVAAYREAQPAPGNALLVELGASATVVALVHRGQGVFATGFPLGTVSLAERIRAERGVSVEEAERMSRTENLLVGPDASPEAVGWLDRWTAELVRILEDWRREHPTAEGAGEPFEVVLGGGGAEIPGLVERLRLRGQPVFRPWPDLPGLTGEVPAGRFAVAYGLACQLLRRAGPSASLVPEEMRAVRRQQQLAHRVQAGAWVVLALVAMVLGFGTWLKYSQISAVEEQIREAGSIIERARRADELAVDLAAAHEALRPVLARQRQTELAVRTLALLGQRPPPTNAWFVLFADADSYYDAPVLPAPTNAVPVTNGIAARLTNAFIAEFSTTLDPVAARAELSGLIDAYQQSRLFAKVDILPAAQRRRLVPDAVVVPKGHYALSFTLPENEFAATRLSPEEQRRLGGPARPERGPGSTPIRRLGPP